MDKQANTDLSNLSESKTPERLFAFSALVFLLIALPVYFLYFNSAIDFQFHDAYWVIALFHIPLGVALFLLFQGFLYFLFRKWKVELLPVLAKAHFALVAIPLFFLTLAAFRFFPFREISPQFLGQLAWACLAAVFLALFMFFCNVSLFIVWQLVAVIGEKRRKNRGISSRK